MMIMMANDVRGRTDPTGDGTRARWVRDNDVILDHGGDLNYF